MVVVGTGSRSSPPSPSRSRNSHSEQDRGHGQDQVPAATGPPPGPARFRPGHSETTASTAPATWPGTAAAAGCRSGRPGSWAAPARCRAAPAGSPPRPGPPGRPRPRSAAVPTVPVPGWPSRARAAPAARLPVLRHALPRRWSHPRHGSSSHNSGPSAPPLALVAASTDWAVSSTSSSTSGSVTTRGGPSMTRSPSVPSAQPVDGYSSRPRSRAAATARSVTRRRRGNGALVARSATSSTATIRPRPRMSPAAGWSPRRSSQAGSEALALGLGRLDQVAFAQDAEDGPAGGGPDHVVGVGEAVGEAAGADGVVDRAARHGQPQRPVAGGGPLGQDQDVGPDRPVVAGEPAAGAAEPGHDLVGDEQHPVAAADLGDRRPVVVGGHGRRRAPAPATGSATNAATVPGRRGEDLLLERRRRSGPRSRPGGCRGRGSGTRTAGRVWPARPSHGQVRAAQRLAAADVEGPPGVAVVAALAADHPPAVLAPGQVVGAGHLEGRLDRLAAARHRVDPRVVHGQQRGQLVGVGLQRSEANMDPWA